MRYFFDDLKNSFDFFLRSNLTFSRKNYSENSCNIDEFDLPAAQNEVYSYLKQRYNLSLFDGLNSRNYFENLYFLCVFDKYFSKREKTEISVLDIGSKNWSYVRSQYLFFKSHSKNLVLNGIELDAYRLCSNFYNRYEIAQFYKKDLPGVNYFIGDFMEHSQKYDYIIWILPFITKYPLIKWGLPLKYFKPEEMLLHAYDLLKPDGEILIINQGEKEAKVQKELFCKTGISACVIPEKLEDVFYLFRNTRYCSKVIT